MSATVSAAVDHAMNTGPPIRIAGLDHVVLRCARLDETMAFYIEVLGCALERELPDIGAASAPGRTGADRSRAGREQARRRRAADPERGNMAHFCLRIDTPDWEAFAAHLQAHGIAFDPPETRYGAGGHGLSVYISDPEGNVSS